MFKLNKILPSLFLLLLAPGLAGCSSSASPVLEVELFGLPRDAARLEVFVTWNGSTGSAVLYRDGMNNYTTVIMQPASMDSPPEAAVALDLLVRERGGRGEAEEIKRAAAGAAGAAAGGTGSTVGVVGSVSGGRTARAERKLEYAIDQSLRAVLGRIVEWGGAAPNPGRAGDDRRRDFHGHRLDDTDLFLSQNRHVVAPAERVRGDDALVAFGEGHADGAA